MHLRSSVFLKCESSRMAVCHVSLPLRPGEERSEEQERSDGQHSLVARVAWGDDTGIIIIVPAPYVCTTRVTAVPPPLPKRFNARKRCI